MDTLWLVFNWLMVHQPPFPWSLIWGAWAFFLTASFVKGVVKEDEDGMLGPFVVSFLTVLFIGLLGGMIAGTPLMGTIGTTGHRYSWAGSEFPPPWR